MYRLFKRGLLLFKEVLWLIYKKYITYRGYSPIGFGYAMRQFVDWIKENTTLKVENVFEIGAQFAQDAQYLMRAFNLKPNQIYVFEAHPDIYKAITKIHKFKAYNYAAFNDEKDITFNTVGLTAISSLFAIQDNIGSKPVLVKSIRMDNFMNDNKIEKIDFLKLDVEGASYEVLEGFGKRLKDIKAMHIEAEHGQSQFWKSIKLFDDISDLLKQNGFEIVYFKRFGMASDSFWVNKIIYKYKN